MKKVLVLIIMEASSAALFAQSDKYVKAMKANIANLDSLLAKKNFTEVSNNFERIGDAEKNQWLPYYYASYSTVMSALTETDKSKTDALADKAEQLIKKAEETSGKENSEICVIKSMIASAHMMVDPQTRWQQYGQTSAENISKAKALDPANPRPVFLEGQAKFFTPESFGGGKAQAKELFTKALQMFDTFKPGSDVDPNWGKSATKYYLAQCN